MSVSQIAEAADRSALAALLFAVMFGAAGCFLLSRGGLVIGAFAWWLCGANCYRALGMATRHK